MPARHVPQRFARENAYIGRLVSELSAANRPQVSTFIVSRRSKTGLAAIRNVVIALKALDDQTQGKAFGALTASDLEAFLNQCLERLAPSTVNGFCVAISQYLKWELQVDTLPRAIRLALTRRRGRPTKNPQPLSDEEFSALLGAAEKAGSLSKRLKWQAMLWTLWETGFRIGELLSLRTGSVEFDGADGARLRLRDGDLGLKTGPRTVYVVHCQRVIRDWLATHPAAHFADAYLFPGNKQRPHSQYMPENVNALFQRLSRRAGTRSIYPHLFRHTAATRCARRGWNEAQLRAYFGWSGTSSMPSAYIHLAYEDMRDQVRRESSLPKPLEARLERVNDPGVLPNDRAR